MKEIPFKFYVNIAVKISAAIILTVMIAKYNVMISKFLAKIKPYRKTISEKFSENLTRVKLFS